MIAITIDCEQWNSPRLHGRESPENDNVLYSYGGNKRLLEILDRYHIPATFFITGFFAEREKEQVKEISKKHEIACHGYHHFYRGRNLDLEELRWDVSKAKKILEKITGKKIIGFRAPQMQFSRKLIKVLEDLNFKYDSSIHAAKIPGYYNHKNVPLKPFKIGESKKITEIPASASYWLRKPISWIFMRNLPLWYSIKIIRGLLKKGIIPVIYFHSWEFFEVWDKNVPSYLTRNCGEKFCGKFERFLRAFRDEKFVLMKELC